MNRLVLLSRIVLFITVLLTTAGCGMPGTRPYQPLPDYESGFYEKAERNLFPKDVLQNPALGKNTLVAWTGIIRKISLDDKYPTVRMEIEHRYFDWIEDNGAQKEKFFLSPRGEGKFIVAWPISTEGEQQFIDQFVVGDMIVAYGKPSMIKGDTIGFFPTVNIRAIKPDWYRTDILDYGRPG